MQASGPALLRKPLGQDLHWALPHSSSPCSPAATRGEESPISWANKATAQLSGTPKHSPPEKAEKFNPMQCLGTRVDHYQQRANSQLITKLSDNSLVKHPLLPPLVPTTFIVTMLPRVVQEAGTRRTTTEEHLPTTNLIPSVREVVEQTSLAFSGVPFGVSSSCLGEEEAGEEGSLLSRSL